MTTFVDSSFLIALFNKDDQFHQQAKNLTLQLEQKRYLFITSNIALAEAINVIFRLKGTKDSSSFYSLVLNSNLKLFAIDNQIFKSGTKLLFAQKTKRGLNFFDCLHLSTMQSLGIETILTFDSDFKKAKVKTLGIK